MRVRIGTLLPDLRQPTKIDLPSGDALTLEPIVRRGRADEGRRRVGHAALGLPVAGDQAEGSAHHDEQE